MQTLLLRAKEHLVIRYTVRTCAVVWASNTEMVIHKRIRMDKSTKIGYEGVSGPRTTQRGVSSKFAAVPQFHPQPNNNFILAYSQDDKEVTRWQRGDKLDAKQDQIAASSLAALFW